MTQEQCKRIRQILSRQSFADWYNTGKFNDWITGDLEHRNQLTRVEGNAEIDKDIQRIFGPLFGLLLRLNLLRKWS